MLDFFKDLAYVGSCGLVDFDESPETSYTVRRKHKFDTESFVFLQI